MRLTKRPNSPNWFLEVQFKGRKYVRSTKTDHKPTGKWSDEDNLAFSDEYDTYLLSAALQLRQGNSKEVVIEYLEHIASNHTGLGKNEQTCKNVEAVVDAILSDYEIWTYPNSKGNFG